MDFARIESELLEAICGSAARVGPSPDEDDHRLILAEFYDEQNDPRGRFIRVQLALERMSEFDPRRAVLRKEEASLIARHERTWCLPLRGKATGITFRGGLIDGVKMTARQFLREAEFVFAHYPIRKLDLLDAGGQAAMVFRSPWLTKLRSFSLYAQHIGSDELFQRFVECPHFESLQSLELGRNHLTDRAVDMLTRFGPIAKLRELSLRENPCGGDGLRALATAAVELRTLNLASTNVTATAIDSLIPLAINHQLKSVDISANPAFGRMNRACPELLTIPELNLSQCELTVLSLERMLSAQPMPIRSLNVSQNRLGDTGVRRLVESDCLSEIQTLNLSHNEIGDDGAIAIAQSPLLRRCVRLDLSFNPIGPVGFAALLDAAALPNVRQLNWSNAGLSRLLNEALADKFR